MPRSRKFNGYCEQCKKSLCPEHTYSYVDGNNEAITYNAPYLCKDCYEEKYHTKIMTDVEMYRNNLINTLLRIKNEQKIQQLSLEKLIEYISNS